jgi:hypothetical protein
MRLPNRRSGVRISPGALLESAASRHLFWQRRPPQSGDEVPSGYQSAGAVAAQNPLDRNGLERVVRRDPGEAQTRGLRTECLRSVAPGGRDARCVRAIPEMGPGRAEPSTGPPLAYASQALLPDFPRVATSSMTTTRSQSWWHSRRLAVAGLTAASGRVDSEPRR